MKAVWLVTEVTHFRSDEILSDLLWSNFFWIDLFTKWTIFGIDFEMTYFMFLGIWWHVESMVEFKL